MKLLHLAFAVTACIAPGLALSQSFNVDLDISFGGGGVGRGAPSPSFGGAIRSPGYWNRIEEGNPRQPVHIRGLDGKYSTVQLWGTGGLGGGGGYNNHSNTGDFNFLLNDYARIGGENDYHFLGLRPGRYRVCTYTVSPFAAPYYVTTIQVPGAINPVQTVAGSMPGNRFLQGVTHSVHYIDFPGGSLDIDISGPWPHALVNGFQIQALPPIPIWATALQDFGG